MREIEIVLGMIVDGMRHEILLNSIHVIVARKFMIVTVLPHG